MTGLERRKAALAANRKDPGEARLSHQGYRWLNRGLAPLCSACVLKDHCDDYSDAEGATCPLIEEAHQQLVSQLVALEHIDPVTDRPLVDEYVRSLLFLRLIDLWASQAGLFVVSKQPKTGQQLVDVQPVFKVRYTVAAHAKRLAEALQLTPASRKGIEQQAGGLTATIISLDQERQEEENGPADTEEVAS